MNIQEFWDAVLKQDAEKMRTYFREDAYVNWHCTNEHFTVEEYIRANCEYPGEWDGTVERIEKMNDLTVAAVNVYARDRSASFHVVSFMRLEEDKICSLDEYWGDDGTAPQWRRDKKIGAAIH
jgi:ketosteroid isomerase-like protein